MPYNQSSNESIFRSNQIYLIYPEGKWKVMSYIIQAQRVVVDGDGACLSWCRAFMERGPKQKHETSWKGHQWKILLILFSNCVKPNQPIPTQNNGKHTVYIQVTLTGRNHSWGKTTLKGKQKYIYLKKSKQRIHLTTISKWKYVSKHNNYYKCKQKTQCKTPLP